MHHDACTHVGVLGHHNNMRDNTGDTPAVSKGLVANDHSCKWRYLTG
jgi:hypothetical protein